MTPPLSPGKVRELSQKWLEGTITPEEKLLLEAWYNQQPPEQLEWPSADRDAGEMGERLFARIRKKALDETPVVKLKTRRLVTWWAAAAVLLFALAGSYFYLHQPKIKPQLAKYDIAPGHNQATLTLANGKKIILTKGLSGQLAVQNNTTINATQNDIVYQAKNQTEDQISYNTLSTAQGEQSPYPLVLADGTKVWLNAESSITFPTAFNGKDRKVTVTGEAYFEVAHNAKQPFTVAANGQTIQDIGTAFDVNAYSNEPVLETTLVEGSIRINHIVLKPGQQARNTAGSIKVISDVNTKVYTAWKDGYFRYDLETLPGIMREFARWYKVEVVFATPPSDQQFNMKVSRKATLNRALEILANGGVRYKLEGSKLIITP